MKNLLNRTLSVLCAVMLLISAVSAWAAAEEEAATPTDLNPSEEEIIPKEPAEEKNEPQESVEVIVATGIKLGESWEGRTRNTKPVVLKIDIFRAQNIYMLVEGKNIWAVVQKSDRSDENICSAITDFETEQAIVSWYAEAGSYLITIAPEGPNLLARGKVTFMDEGTFQTWESDQGQNGPEQEQEAAIEAEAGAIEEDNGSVAEPENDLGKEPDGITEDEPGDKLEDGEKEEDLEEERSVDITISFGEKGCRIGYPVYFTADLTNYDGYNYTLQWQMSKDRNNWSDLTGENSSILEITLTEENRLNYWRIIVSIEDDQSR